MYKKISIMFILAIIGAFSLLSNSTSTSWNWLTQIMTVNIQIAILIIGIYFFTVGVFVFLDSKNIFTSFIYLLIPVAAVLLLFPLLTILGLGETESTIKTVISFILIIITYLTPILTYMLYHKLSRIK